MQKGECRPKADANYMNLKRQSIVRASQPTRQVQQLDKAVVNYKPVSVHKNEAEFEQKKKAEGKKARDDRDKVSEVLFSAFEKHQYYALKDLVKITKQPTVSPILCRWFSLTHVFPAAVLKGDPERGVYLQFEESAQKHVGTETGVQTLQQ